MKKIGVVSLFLLLIVGCKQNPLWVGPHEYIWGTYSNYGGNFPKFEVTDQTPFTVCASKKARAQDLGNGTVQITLDGIQVVGRNNAYSIDGFTIFESKSGKYQEQSEFSSNSSSELSAVKAVIVLDFSSSIGSNISDLKKYAKDAIELILDKNQASHVALIIFSKYVTFYPFQDKNGINILNNAIDNSTNTEDRTTLYGAVERAITELNASPLHGVKTIMTFTDGGDNNTDNPDAAITEIQGAKDTIKEFAIAMSGDDYDKSAVKNIASGQRYWHKATSYKKLEKIFNRVSNEVSNVYKLVYLRSDQALDNAIDIRIQLDVSKAD